MPLRVSANFDDPSAGESKKAHKKMSRRGHLQKVRRPTNLEVYTDAAKILEELLEKRIDRNLQVQNRQKRNKTDPNTERVISTIAEPDNPVARSKTMPSKYRESPSNDARKKEMDAILRRDEKEQRQADNGFVSSADTEGEEEDHTMEKRKKKSLFKMAKERLIHTFNRDQKDGLGRVKEKPESPTVKRRKPKKKGDKDKASGEVISETNRHIKARLNNDNSVDYTEEVEQHNKSGSVHKDVHFRNSRTGSFSRNALINTLKKPFKKPGRPDSKLEDIKSPKSSPEKEDLIEESSPSLPPPPPSKKQGGKETLDSPYSPPGRPSLHGIPSTQEAGGSLSSKSPSPPPKSQNVADGHPFNAPGMSSSSSVFPMSDYNSMGSLTNVLPSIKSNVLDSPGEDIEYMDIEIDEKWEDDGGSQTRAIHTTGIKFHTSEGLLNFNWLADQTADRAKSLDYEIDERSVSRLRPDGDMETTTTLTATRTVVMPDVQEEDEHEQDIVDGDDDTDKPINKDELYGKIAQKLIAMADTYSANVSDPESAGAATASSDVPLTDLEKEIIACLRSKDKYSKELEDKLKEATTSTVGDAYQRFHSTIQNSLGTELSWNHLAFLFYTTKGVVSALGKGSTAANQAKDFTLQYISDTFASWIMDQGGFDSMLSSSESDPEVD